MIDPSRFGISKSVMDSITEILTTSNTEKKLEELDSSESPNHQIHMHTGDGNWKKIKIPVNHRSEHHDDYHTSKDEAEKFVDSRNKDMTKAENATRYKAVKVTKVPVMSEEEILEESKKHKKMDPKTTKMTI